MATHLGKFIFTLNSEKGRKMKFRYKDFELELHPSLVIPCLVSFDYTSVLEMLNKLFS